MTSHGADGFETRSNNAQPVLGQLQLSQQRPALLALVDVGQRLFERSTRKAGRNVTHGGAGVGPRRSVLELVVIARGNRKAPGYANPIEEDLALWQRALAQLLQRLSARNAL